MNALTVTKRIFFVFTLILGLIVGAGSVFAATVPQVASAIGRDLDRQAAARLGQETPVMGLSLSVLTPVELGSLEVSNALARQMQEEIALWFVQSGYEVHEIRKGASVLFAPDQGELLLTRKQRHLESAKVCSMAIVSGTYTVTPKSVRFNIKIIATGSREVLAMSNMTVPLCREVAALLKVGGKNTSRGTPIEPTVVTLLP